MRRYCYILCLCLISICSDKATSQEKLSEITLIDALSKGRSLVIAEILSKGMRENGIWNVRIKIVKPVIYGDLKEDDCDEILDLFAGASDKYVERLETGLWYALFVLKDCPYEYSWAHRDNFQLINKSDNTEIEELTHLAEVAYTKTSMLAFRKDLNAKEITDITKVPKEIISLCEQFKNNPEKRSVVAEKIYLSDISTRIKLERPSSVQEIIPPKIILSRNQIVSLLGPPTLKSGWTYSWLCGQPVERGRSDRDVFVLSVTFDTDQKVQKVIYGQDKKDKWTKIDRPVNTLYGLPGQPESVLLKFQRVLQKQDWKNVLSLCSENIRKKAQEYNSLEKFFQNYLPIEDLIKMREFQTNGYSGSSDNILKINLDIELSAYDPETYNSVSWKWSLVRNEGTWLVDFKTVLLEHMIQKEILRRKLRDENYETRRVKFEKGIRYNLTPLTENFVVGKPFTFRIELKNMGDVPILYMTLGLLMINDPMNITGPNGEKIKYIDFDSQTLAGEEVVLPWETIVLVENYDAASQYYITTPGRYSFQFQSSNKIEVDVQQGEMSLQDEVYTKLLSILPQGWTIIRRMTSSSDPYSFVEEQNKYLFVHMIGKRRGLQIDVDIRLAIVEDVSKIDKNILSEFQVLGKSNYGVVFCKVQDAQSLWPDYRSQIIKTLGIKEIHD
jgi:hypothetical protein